MHQYMNFKPHKLTTLATRLVLETQLQNTRGLGYKRIDEKFFHSLYSSSFPIPSRVSTRNAGHTFLGNCPCYKLCYSQLYNYTKHLRPARDIKHI